MSSTREIILSAKRSDFRSDTPHPKKGNTEFLDAKPRVLKRDNHTCQFCGFRAKKFQHVHHLDDNHENNDESNLITSCALCHMCHHVGYAGITGKGTLIYLKQLKFGDIDLNITQAKINHLIKLLWVLESSENTETKNQASDFIQRLEVTRLHADKYLGTCNPMVLGNALRELSDENYSNRGNTLKDIYLLPYREGYEKEINYWAESEFKHIKNQNWAIIAKNNMFNWVKTASFAASPSGIRQYLEDKKIY